MTLYTQSKLGALVAQRGLRESTTALNTTFERLSSGQRINSASDDPAGLALSEKLKNNSLVQNRGRKNVNDGISLLNHAEAALSELSNIVIKIQELAEQAATGTLSSVQREALNTEAQGLSDEFGRISRSTKYNGSSLFSNDYGVLSLQAGEGTAAVISSSLGGTVSNETYQAAVTAGSSTDAYYLESADLNNDGNMDFVFSDQFSHEIKIYTGNGDGSFSSAGTYATGTRPRGITINDFDNDGVMDIATANDLGTNVSVLIGNGDATFAAAVNYSTGAPSLGVISADFDSDGNIDLMSSDFSSNTNSIFLGNGDGTFQAASSFASVANTYQATAKDFNSDGTLDIASIGIAGTIAVQLGNGDGTFGSATNYSTTGSGSFSFDTQDINGDGVLDFVAVNAAQDNLAILTGNSDGTFNTAVTISASDNINYVRIADMNSDGNQDIVTTSWNEGEVSIFYGNGDSTFQTKQDTASGTNTYGFAIEDFNNDGVYDIVAANSGDLAVSYIKANTTSGLADILEFDLSTEASALQAIAPLERKLQSLSTHKGAVGAFMSRLESANSLLGNQVSILNESVNKILDIDAAFESANMLKNKILQDSSSAMLAQSNLQSELVLNLLS